MLSFTVPVDLHLPTSRAQNFSRARSEHRTGGFFMFSAVKASDKRRNLRKSTVPGALLPVLAYRKSNFKKAQSKYFKENKRKAKRQYCQGLHSLPEKLETRWK